MRKTCLNEIYKLAKKDKRVIFFGSDIAAGTLDEFKQDMPDRYFMEGVSEAHIIGMISGLAMNGKIPYLNNISAFLTRRCYEQILLDAAKHNLKIRLIGSGGGLVYGPLGSTHIAFEDIAILRAIPNMTIVVPCDSEEMKRFIPQTLDYEGPIYIRLSRGGEPIVSSPDKTFKIGKAIVIGEGRDVLIITTGITLKLAIEASHLLKHDGINTTILHIHTIKPIDMEKVLVLAENVKSIITIEEHSKIGGLGSAISEIIGEANFKSPKKFLRIALPDSFPEQYGTQNNLMKLFGITTENLVMKIKSLFK